MPDSDRESTGASEDHGYDAEFEEDSGSEQGSTADHDGDADDGDFESASSASSGPHNGDSDASESESESESEAESEAESEDDEGPAPTPMDIDSTSRGPTPPADPADEQPYSADDETEEAAAGAADPTVAAAEADPVDEDGLGHLTNIATAANAQQADAPQLPLKVAPPPGRRSRLKRRRRARRNHASSSQAAGAAGDEEEAVHVNLTACRYPVVWEACRKAGWTAVADDHEWTVTWSDTTLPMDRMIDVKNYQRLNHFPGMHEIARKNLLAKNLGKMARVEPDEYEFMPRSWLLPTEYTELMQYQRRKGSGTYIVKPEASSQGKGIYLTQSLDELKATDHVVVQEYLERPFLINGYKFDMRIYVLVTCCDPLTMFLYNDGLARFCTEKYVVPGPDNIEKTYMHLTNYAINKTNANYVFNSDADNTGMGSKWTLGALNDWLEARGFNVRKMWASISDIIVKTMISIQPHLRHLYRTSFTNNNDGFSCFEILGFDVMLDRFLRPWMIEVNHAPSFATDTPLDLTLKSGLLQDSIHLLNLSPSDKRRFHQEARHRIEQRARKGRNFREEKALEATKRQRVLEERTRFENANLRNYQRMFPTHSTRDAVYQRLFEVSERLFEEHFAALTTAGGRRAREREKDREAREAKEAKARGSPTKKRLAATAAAAEAVSPTASRVADAEREGLGFLAAHVGNPHRVDKDGCTALFLASADGMCDWVDILLATGTDVMATNAQAMNPIHAAAWGGHHDVIVLLLKHLLSRDLQKEATGLANAPDKSGVTPIMLAAKAGASEACRVLLVHGASPLVTDSDDASTLLHMICAAKSPKCLKTVLSEVQGSGKALDVNQTNAEGQTPLHVACQKGSPACVSILIEFGANVVAEAASGETPVVCAARCQSNSRATDSIALLLQAGAVVTSRTRDGTPLLHLAVRRGNRDLAGLLLANGANVMDLNKNGDSAGHVAARCGHPACLNLLLSSGADPRALNYALESPLALAVRAKKHTRGTVAVLFEYGASLEPGDFDDKNCAPRILRSCVDGSSESLLTYLVQHGAATMVIDELDNTLLHYAVARGKKKAVAVVSGDQGALRLANKNGDTPLHLAAAVGHHAILSQLIDRGSNVNARNGDGNTALHLSAAAGSLSCVNALIGALAKSTFRNHIGLTPGAVAHAEGHTVICKALRHFKRGRWTAGRASAKHKQHQPPPQHKSSDKPPGDAGESEDAKAAEGKEAKEGKDKEPMPRPPRPQDETTPVKERRSKKRVVVAAGEEPLRIESVSPTGTDAAEVAATKVVAAGRRKKRTEGLFPDPSLRSTPTKEDGGERRDKERKSKSKKAGSGGGGGGGGGGGSSSSITAPPTIAGASPSDARPVSPRAPVHKPTMMPRPSAAAAAAAKGEHGIRKPTLAHNIQHSPYLEPLTRKSRKQQHHRGELTIIRKHPSAAGGLANSPYRQPLVLRQADTL